MRDKRISIYLHGRLKKQFGKESQILYIRTPAEAIRALCVLLPGFENAIREGEFRLKTGREPLTESMLGLPFGRAKTLHIYPIVQGRGFVEGATLAYVLAGVALVGVAYALTQIPTVSDYTVREPNKKPSYLFNGSVNTVAQGGVVPLIFGGPIRIGSTVVSAGVTSDAFSGDASIPANDVSKSYLIGGSGGGGSARNTTYVAVEADDTLASRSRARIVDLIAEGEIRGLVDGLRSIYIDRTPVQNEDGSYNFGGLQFAPTVGLPDQSSPGEHAEVETERNVSLAVTHGNSITQTITNNQADTARVTIRFPRLSQVANNGDTNGTSVRFEIHVQSDGDSGKKVIDRTISDKTTSPIDISYLIPLEGSAPWNIRVTRVSADSISDKLHNQTIWQSLTEITNLKQTYPHSAMMSVAANAVQFNGQLTDREYEVYGMIVDVPSNYNAYSRQYSGVWDGSFKRSWTDNGAWILYALLTDDRFGLGADIPADQVTASKWELYQIAQFNDELVPNGRGGSEPRYRFSGVINKAENALKVLANVLGNFRASLYYGANGVMPIQDSPTEATVLVTNANVIDGDFQYSDLPMTERYSAVAVSFNDPNDEYKLGVELVVDDKLVQKYGYRQTDRAAMFCTSRSQAHRLGKHILAVQEYESDTLRYRTSLEHASIRPGQVIKQTDTRVAGARYGVRVVEYSVERNQLGIDNGASIPNKSGGRYSVDVVLRDGSIRMLSASAQRYSYSWGDNYQLWGGRLSADEAPLPGSPCVFYDDNIEPRLWRIISVKEIDDMEFEFEAHAYHPDLYDLVENDINIDVPNYSSVPTGDLIAPTGLSAEERLYQDGVVVKSELTISVDDTNDARAQYTEFSVKRPGDPDYTITERTTARQFELRDTQVGVYDIRARYVGWFNQLKSPWVSLLKATEGKTARPNQPDELVASIRANTGVVLSVTPINDIDLDHYKYYVGDEYATARRLAQGKFTEYVWATASAGQHTFWVTAHDTSNAINGGSEPVSASITIRPPATPRIATEYNGDSIVTTWQDCATDFAIAKYEVLYNDAVIASVSATEWRYRVNFIGNRTYQIRAVDIAGNSSTVSSISITPTLPSKPEITARVIDNSALFNYDSTAGSLPILYYEVRRSGSNVVTKKSGDSSFTVINEIEGGNYQYEWVAVDTAGNRSEAMGVEVAVTQPQDYELLAEYSESNDNWPGARTNVVILQSGRLIAPVNADETWREHFDNNGWNNPRDQINARFPRYLQPNTGTAEYSRVIDYGTILQQALLTLAVARTNLVYRPSITTTLEYSEDQIDWVSTNNREVFATNFRYVRYTVSIVAVRRKALLVLDNIQLKLDVKMVGDSGQADANADDANGTWIPFNQAFIDAQQPVITPGGSSPLVGVANFEDAPNPTGFHAFLYNLNGQRVGGRFGWTTRGVTH